MEHRADKKCLKELLTFLSFPTYALKSPQNKIYSIRLRSSGLAPATKYEMLVASTSLYRRADIVFSFIIATGAGWMGRVNLGAAWAS